MVSVDEEKCIGCGVCVQICEEIFEIKDGKAKIKIQKDTPCIKEAIKSCPVNAIRE